MNILMLVMSMLMIFGIMTYTKYTKFKSETVLKAQFDNYMEFSERLYINDSAIKSYSNTHYSSTKNSSGKTKNTNSSKLPIHSLLESQNPEEDASINVSQETKLIFKELIKNLYSNYEFYKKIQNERPDFIDEIIANLQIAKNNLSNDQKIHSAKDLANLDLRDSQLNDFFYSILKGAAIPNKTPEGTVIEGYPSITSFLDVRKNKKMRIYLAPKPILDIVFDPSVADEIVQMRESLYNDVNSGRLNVAEASERFQAMYKYRVKQNFVNMDFDFTVSKTDPKNYKSS